MSRTDKPGRKHNLSRTRASTSQSYSKLAALLTVIGGRESSSRMGVGGGRHSFLVRDYNLGGGKTRIEILIWKFPQASRLLPIHQWALSGSTLGPTALSFPVPTHCTH